MSNPFQFDSDSIKTWKKSPEDQQEVAQRASSYRDTERLFVSPQRELIKEEEEEEKQEEEKNKERPLQYSSLESQYDDSCVSGHVSYFNTSRSNHRDLSH